MNYQFWQLFGLCKIIIRSILIVRNTSNVHSLRIEFNAFFARPFLHYQVHFRHFLFEWTTPLRARPYIRRVNAVHVWECNVWCICMCVCVCVCLLVHATSPQPCHMHESLPYRYILRHVSVCVCVMSSSRTSSGLVITQHNPILFPSSN